MATGMHIPSPMDLSIIIPTYNRNSHLDECLQALEHNHAEIIVVDDGSPIPVEVPPYVRLLRHDRNRGRAAAVNTGLRAAAHDLVLVIDDDIYAAPDMVVRLVDEFTLWNNPKLAIVGRVVWDPDVKLTPTMQWLEEAGPFHDISVGRSGPLSNLATGNTIMWRPFVLQYGGFDENFTHYGLEDVELGLRLKQHGLEVRLLAPAVGYHHKSMKVRDLVNRELQEGLSAVYLYSKFPDYIPQVADTDTLLRSASTEADVEAAVGEIALVEQTESTRLPQGIAEVFTIIYRHYFLKGILNGLTAQGALQPGKRSTASLGLYNEASHLESIGELDEARRIFRLVRERKDSAYWAGAEYHLGVIETRLGNDNRAREHYKECLQLNPEHRKAAEALKVPSVFREIRPNVFERLQKLPKAKVLFAMSGDLADVIAAFPVLAALREKFHASEIVWLAQPEFVSLARASFADSVHENESPEMIPWQWIQAQGFTHVFYPGVNANPQEWEMSGLLPMDFMASKCDVELESRKPWLEPGPEAIFNAEQFMEKRGLRRKQFVTASCEQNILAELQVRLGVPVVAIEGSDYRMLAALVRCSAFFVGSNDSVTWIAGTTKTPMGVFAGHTSGIKDSLRDDRDDLVEWATNTSMDAVVDHIATFTQSTTPAARPAKVFSTPLL